MPQYAAIEPMHDYVSSHEWKSWALTNIKAKLDTTYKATD